MSKYRGSGRERAAAAAAAAGGAAGHGCRGRRRCRSGGPARRASPVPARSSRRAAGTPARSAGSSRSSRPSRFSASLPVAVDRARGRRRRRRPGSRPASSPTSGRIARGPAPRPGRRGAAAGCPAPSRRARPGPPAAAAGRGSRRSTRPAGATTTPPTSSNQTSDVTGRQASGCRPPAAGRPPSADSPRRCRAAPARRRRPRGGPRRRRASSDRLVDGEDAPGQDVPVVGRRDPGPARRQLGPPRRVGEQLAQRAGQGGRVPAADQHAGLAVLQHPGEGVEVAGDDRRAGGQRLDEDDAERLAQQVGRAVDVDRAQERGLVRSRTARRAARRAARRSSPISSRHLGGVAAAGDQQPRAGMPPDDGAHRLEQHRQALARLVEAAEEADRRPVDAARVPGQRRARRAKASTCTPFGMITASPPRCSTCTRRAKSDTAIRPVIRSSHGRTTGPQAASHFERTVAAWKVATIGPLAIMQTSRDTDGGAGLVHVDDVEVGPRAASGAPARPTPGRTARWPSSRCTGSARCARRR